LRRGRRDDPARLLRLAQELLASRFDPTSQVVAAWRRGEPSDAEAAQRLLAELATPPR
jgi:DNA-binding transcriptional regulator YiaG